MLRIKQTLDHISRKTVSIQTIKTGHLHLEIIQFIVIINPENLLTFAKLADLQCETALWYFTVRISKAAREI